MFALRIFLLSEKEWRLLFSLFRPKKISDVHSLHFLLFKKDRCSLFAHFCSKREQPFISLLKRAKCPTLPDKRAAVVGVQALAMLATVLPLPLIHLAPAVDLPAVALLHPLLIIQLPHIYPPAGKIKRHSCILKYFMKSFL